MTFIDGVSPTKLIKNYEEVYLLGKKYAANPDNLEQVNKEIY